MVSIDSDATKTDDADTIKLPLISPNVFTLNPLSGEIDAVADPLLILVRSKSFNALIGISNNLSPLPE